MSAGKQNFSPRIANRRAFHEYEIIAKIECGIVLLGSEVKSLRLGRAQLQDAFARVEHGELWLHKCHIDVYDKAGVYTHEPTRARKLLAHRREIHKLESQSQQRGSTLVPLAIYFKEGKAKVEIALARGKRQHDKRAAIRRKEQDREMRRSMMSRR